MFVAFDKLPSNSRIWIYQADRELSDGEVSYAASVLESFCGEWTAHQQPLRTSFAIEHARFFILGADEDFNLPSGCSIDSSVRALKQIESQINVNLFDRTKVAFWVAGTVVVHRAADLRDLFERKVLTGDSIVFDNLVPSRGDLEKRWKVSSEKAWVAKYLPKPALPERV